MSIIDSREGSDLLTATCDVGGRRIEFTSYRGGAFEVYDHPPSWAGLPRFCGYLPEATGAKLRALLARRVAA